MTMSPYLERIGGQYWHTDGGAAGSKYLRLTKAGLGEFVFGVLSVGGEVLQLWPFNRNYLRCTVEAVVAMTPEMRVKFEASSGYRLRVPPTIHLN